MWTAVENLEKRLLLSQVFVVDNTRDDSSPGTFRAAINLVNAGPGSTPADPDTIQFAIPLNDPGFNGSVWSIQPITPLPPIFRPVIIDGYSQSGSRKNTLVDGDDAILRIQLDGSGALQGGPANGITLLAGGSTVQGLVINRFAGSGIVILSGQGSQIVGNFLGTDSSGTVDLGNQLDGVRVDGFTQATSIGGTTPALRNVISGNGNAGVSIVGSGASINAVQGNFIGIPATGVGSLGNDVAGVAVDSASGNLIGGTASGARNVITGNAVNPGTVQGFDISISSGFGGGDSNRIQGNFIGLDARGQSSPFTERGGILLSSARNTIGGSTSEARNIIRAGGDGILVLNDLNTIQGNFIGTDASGNTAPGQGNRGAGIKVGANAQLIDGNLIAGNQADGIIFLGGEGSNVAHNTVILNVGNGITTQRDGLFSGQTIQANFIGTNGTGAALGNLGAGIFLDSSSVLIGGTTPAQANVIAFNGGSAGLSGVAIAQGTNNSILGNSIHDNAGLGIDLFPPGVNPNTSVGPTLGPNNGQNYPVLSQAVIGPPGTTLFGTLNSASSPPGLASTFRIEFFASPVPDPSGFGEGLTFIGFTDVTTDPSGNAPFVVTLPIAISPGQFVSATATDSSGNTSEFARNVVAKSTTNTAVTVQPDPVDFGQPVTFTAVVDALAGTQIPTGTVTFTIDNQPPLPAVQVQFINGLAQASFTFNGLLTLGLHGVRATYSGDALNEPSGASVPLTVQAAPTSTGLNIVPNPVIVGQATTFTATVSSGAPIALPGGTVTFFINDIAQPPVPLDTQTAVAQATFSFVPQAIGSFRIIAVYNGDGNFQASSSPSQLLNVIPVPAMGLAVGDATAVVDPIAVTRMTFTVTLNTQVASVPVTVRYATQDGTAKANIDYLPVSGLLTFLPGEAVKTISVGVIGSFRIKPTLNFQLVLSDPVNAPIITGEGVGIGTILNENSTIVTNTNDTGKGSLRFAILTSNATPGWNVVSFAIGGTGPFTIRPLRPLPPITDPASIDGATEPNYNGRPLIVLDGQNAGPSANGLILLAGKTFVRGLSIGRFSGSGIAIGGPGGNVLVNDVLGGPGRGNALDGIIVIDSADNFLGLPGGQGNVVQGNGVVGIHLLGSKASTNAIQASVIGSDGPPASGPTPLAVDLQGNRLGGILLEGAPLNLIGGMDATAGNLISGNGSAGLRISGATASGNMVLANRIGTDGSGSGPRGNATDGVFLDGAPRNLIGWMQPGSGNLISGNGGMGIRIAGVNAAANRIVANFIGTDRSGRKAIPNGFAGILLYLGAHDTVVGGVAAGAGNLISGNAIVGVEIVGPGATRNLLQNNKIGTDIQGLAAIPNGIDGVFIDDAPANLVGTAGAGNLISGNASSGVQIRGPLASGNRLTANRIGLDALGRARLGNQFGIFLNNAPAPVLGRAGNEANLIAGNRVAQVFVSTISIGAVPAGPAQLSARGRRASV